MTVAKSPTVFCAIDTPDLKQAADLARRIGPITGGIKLGLEFFNAQGPQGLEYVMNACSEADFFFDFKFHDIPNTVAGAVRSICQNFAPLYLNVHAAGGENMMRAAKESAAPGTSILGVTILTSLNAEDVKNIGYSGTVQDSVIGLAGLAQKSGLDGVVCSAHEIGILRERFGGSWILMVPGIRPEGTQGKDDQNRVMTPQEALAKGASHLVVGRPITKSLKPEEAAQAILDGLSMQGS